jgi:hypothetical protein
LQFEFGVVGLKTLFNRSSHITLPTASFLPPLFPVLCVEQAQQYIDEDLTGH